MKNSERQRKAVTKAKRIAIVKEKKRLIFNSKLKTQSTPPINLTVTTIGLEKRESGKYKSRWIKKYSQLNQTMKLL